MLASAASGPDELEAMVVRRTSGEPLELVLGYVDFCGVRITVAPGVFIPRRRTELLVSTAVDLASSNGRSPGPHRVVDLCCGSGAIGAALSHTLDSVELYAVDVDPAAVNCARTNLPADARVYQGDLFDPLPPELAGQVDLLVVNAPYVPTGELGLMPRDLRAHESVVAHDGGADGVDVQRRVGADASRWLRPGGHLLTETSRRQVELVESAFAEQGLTTSVTRADALSATVVIGTRPSG